MNRMSPAAGQSRCLRRSGNRRGIALISVLAVLILLTVLVVAFLMRAEVARTSSANYRATTGTRLLADTVLNLVQAEINDATNYGSSSANGGGTAPYTWASQPGAIRVYDSTGAMKKIYRLYSAPSLTTSSVADVLDGSGNSAEITGTGTTGWSNPARWVDLNAPITVTDPSAPTSNFVVYPILDNRNPANTSQCVQMPGFFVNTVGASPVFPTANTTTLNQPYMPVQWLYVLANGQVIAPTGGTGTVATFGANAPTTANPIVGRIAFWTDDDTCKVNINTAGGSLSYRADTNSNGILVSDGGVFFSTSYDETGNAWPPAPWETPRFSGSWEDIKLFAEDQPVQGEYQRYPGHPATTIMYYTLRALGISSTVGFTMPELLTDQANGGLNPYGMSENVGKTATTQDSSLGGSLSWPYTSTLFGIMPRYNDNGGSQGGIANTTYVNPPTAITPKRNRLYTSLGELLYSTNSTGTMPPVRTRNGKLNTSSPQTPITPYFTRQQIETGKFFLTTHSRAPETTLFGTPRVAMWPIPDTAGTSSQGTQMAITTFDKLVQFCATTNSGTNAYYFKRYDSANATNDYTNEPRNQTIYGYLQDLTTGNIPGYGGNFLSKYGTSNIASIASERDQILTEIVDYIRCTNLNEHTWNSAANPIPAGKTTYTASSGTSGKGEVIPLQITKGGYTTQGLGRLLTLSEIGLQIICTADGTNNLVGVNAGNSNTGYVSTANTSTSVAYNVPVITAVSATIPVSPVIGSASDPAYVSNLPVQQFLRDTGNNIVDMFGITVTAANVSNCTPFPANKTLTPFVNNPGTGNYDPTGATLTALQPGQKQLQAMLIFEPASPMLGYDIMANTGGQGPDVNILVNNIQNIAIGGLNPFPSQIVSSTSVGPNVNGNGYLNGVGTTDVGWVNNGDTDVGGILGFRFPMAFFGGTSAQTNINKAQRCNGWSGVSALTPQVSAGTSTNIDTLGGSSGGSPTLTSSGTNMWKAYSSPTTPYRFVSNPFTVSSSTMQLGGSSTFNVALTLPVKAGAAYTQVPYQTYAVAFPAITLPTPTLVTYGFKNRYSSGNNNTYTTHAPDWWGFDNRIGWANNGVPFYATTGGGATTTANLGLGCVIRGDLAPPSGGWGTTTNPWKWNDTGATIGTLLTTNTSYGDVVRSVIPKDGDYRVTMARNSKSDYSVTVNATPGTATSDFTTPPQYSNTTILNTNMFMEPGSSQGTAGVDINGTLLYNYGAVVPAPSVRSKVPSTLSSSGAPWSASPATPNPQTSWDWDNGLPAMSFGAYAGKPDEGNTYSPGGASTEIPYGITGNVSFNNAISYFSANRIVNSPVMFGSLPTGVAEGIPWRTLLFRPQRTVNDTPAGLRPAVSSPSGPKDYLLLDNFWMPVVEPYAISEPFSTAGKVNMNYQILPFTYITRSSGIQAVLSSELVARAPVALSAAQSFGPAAFYQGGTAGIGTGTSQSSLYAGARNGTTTPPARLPLNLSEVNGTLRQFRAKFTSGDLFRSPAEICDIYLVPKDSMNPGLYNNWTSDSAADTAWYGTDFGLVGDNVREHPYGDIYPRLTTKSNTYTVYYKVQVLKNPPNANQAQWDESTGVVTGEYRGSTSLERYLDPNNNAIPDYTTSANNPAVTSGAASLDNYYQWRTVANNAFAP